VTTFIDTAIIMYAAGGDHPLRAASREILQRVSDGDIDGVISVEVIQEIVHRFARIGRGTIGQAQAIEAMDLFAPVLPVTHALMRRVPEFAARYPGLDSRDVVHVATCVHEGIATIISPDRGFDDVAEVRRIDPAEFAVEPRPRA
jgi:predicted nucleic acid-binding protein